MLASIITFIICLIITIENVFFITHLSQNDTTSYIDFSIINKNNNIFSVSWDNQKGIYYASLCFVAGICSSLAGIGG